MRFEVITSNDMFLVMMRIIAKNRKWGFPYVYLPDVTKIANFVAETKADPILSFDMKNNEENVATLVVQDHFHPKFPYVQFSRALTGEEELVLQVVLAVANEDEGEVDILKWDLPHRFFGVLYRATCSHRDPNATTWFTETYNERRKEVLRELFNNVVYMEEEEKKEEKERKDGITSRVARDEDTMAKLQLVHKKGEELEKPELERILGLVETRIRLRASLSPSPSPSLKTRDENLRARIKALRGNAKKEEKKKASVVAEILASIIPAPKKERNPRMQPIPRSPSPSPSPERQSSPAKKKTTVAAPFVYTIKQGIDVERRNPLLPDKKQRPSLSGLFVTNPKGLKPNSRLYYDGVKYTQAEYDALRREALRRHKQTLRRLQEKNSGDDDDDDEEEAPITEMEKYIIGPLYKGDQRKKGKGNKKKKDDGDDDVYYIDANPKYEFTHPCIARYINEPSPGQKANAIFYIGNGNRRRGRYVRDELGRVYVIIVTEVKEGEEILVHYGEDYDRNYKVGDPADFPEWLD